MQRFSLKSSQLFYKHVFRRNVTTIKMPVNTWFVFDFLFGRWKIDYWNRYSHNILSKKISQPATVIIIVPPTNQIQSVSQPNSLRNTTWTNETLTQSPFNQSNLSSSSSSSLLNTHYISPSFQERLPPKSTSLVASQTPLNLLDPLKRGTNNPPVQFRSSWPTIYLYTIQL